MANMLPIAVATAGLVMDSVPAIPGKAIVLATLDAQVRGTNPVVRRVRRLGQRVTQCMVVSRVRRARPVDTLCHSSRELSQRLSSAPGGPLAAGVCIRLGHNDEPCVQVPHISHRCKTEGLWLGLTCVRGGCNVQAKALGAYKGVAYGTVLALQAAVGAPYAGAVEAQLTAGLKPLVALAVSTLVSCVGVYLAFLIGCACAAPRREAAATVTNTLGAVAAFLTPAGVTLGAYGLAASGASCEVALAAYVASAGVNAAAAAGLAAAPLAEATAVLVVPTAATLYLLTMVYLRLYVRARSPEGESISGGRGECGERGGETVSE